MEVRDASAGYEPQVNMPVVPEGYKQTEVGLIPEDWEVKRFDEVLVRLNAKANQIQTSDYRSTGMHPVVDQGKRLVVGFSDRGDKLFSCPQRGVIVFGDHTCIIKFVSFDFLVGADGTQIINGRPGQLIAFYAYQLQYRGVEPTGYNRHFKFLKEKIFAVPSEPEQTAIATALSDVDALLEALDRLIAKKRDIKQATMQQLLTAQTRLPGFEGEWEVRSLLEIADNQKSLFDDGDWVEAEHITDQGIRLVQTGNIGSGVFVEKAARKYINEASFNKLKCKELEVGDILICRLAEPAGRACVLPDIGESRVITSVDVTIFRPRLEIVDRRFIVQYFSTSSWFKKVLDNVGGTTHKRISRGALGKLKVPFPPVEEQEAIAKVLTDMDANLEALRERRAKTAALKQALMQELLTGRTRLVDLVSKERAND